MYSKALFDQAISLQKGDKMLIPCENKREQESVRVSLYHLRSLLSRSNRTLANELFIYRANIEGKLFVTIEHSKGSSGAIIIHKDGSISEANIEVETSELARIIGLMLSDGLRTKEILENLSETYSPKDILDEIVRQSGNGDKDGSNFDAT